MSRIWLPNGVRREIGPKLPEGDVRLSDGRILVQGKTHGAAVCVWQTRDGLRVGGLVIDHPVRGRILHLVVSYASRAPTWSDLRRVRAAFFGDQDCFIPFGKDDDSEGGNTVHLWSSTP